MQKDYTRKSQRLAELEKNYNYGAQAEKAVNSIKASDVPPDIQKAILDVVKPYIQAQKNNEELENTFTGLERKWDGADGKPKYNPANDRDDILEYMGRSGSKVFDPEIAFEQLHKDEILDWEIKQALKRKSGSSRTEQTGGNRKLPSYKPPKTFEEASRRAISRMQDSDLT